ncbi:LysR family transcriptional regulator, partial [Klebsiella pneumoniae]|uniref:LysR family transcriptional regulator n=2 Tax=Pseudomonadota TaxID=1224 RepID=UPI003B981E06
MDEVERRLRAVNLNMLPVLRAILKHRNLTRAAEELNLTQSAVSNILKRLRDHFDDDLLIRDGRQFRLTERANRLFGPLDDA